MVEEETLTAKLHNLNFHPLEVCVSSNIISVYPFEVVSRYDDTQLQVDGNDWYLFNLQILMFK